jgi:hypothetical protein
LGHGTCHCPHTKVISTNREKQVNTINLNNDEYSLAGNHENLTQVLETTLEMLIVKMIAIYLIERQQNI